MILFSFGFMQCWSLERVEELEFCWGLFQVLMSKYLTMREVEYIICIIALLLQVNDAKMILIGYWAWIGSSSDRFLIWIYTVLEFGRS